MTLHLPSIYPNTHHEEPYAPTGYKVGPGMYIIYIYIHIPGSEYYYGYMRARFLPGERDALVLSQVLDFKEPATG